MIESGMVVDGFLRVKVTSNGSQRHNVIRPPHHEDKFLRVLAQVHQ